MDKTKLASRFKEKTKGGQPIEKNRNEIKKVNEYVPQDIVLENLLTARDNLVFFGGVYNTPRKELKDKVNKMLKGIGLADRANEPVKNYSGGMKRRFNIGCALMQDPILIIMDEPTVGIDPQSRNYIYLIIEKLIKKAKRSSIPAITWKKCRTYAKKLCLSTTTIFWNMGM